MATIEIIKSLLPEETSEIGADFGSVSLLFGDEDPADNTAIDTASIKVVAEDPALSDYLAYEARGDTLQFTNIRPIDFDDVDTPKSFTFTVQFDIDKITVRDGKPVASDYKIIEKTYTIKVADLNDETPSNLQLSGSSIVETAAGGKLVGRLSAADPDRGDTLTYSLLDDPSGLFELVGARLLLKAGARLDHETQSSHDVTVMVQDEALHAVTKTFTIDVLGAAERVTDITLEGGSASELAEAGTVVGTLSGLDPDGDPSRITYEIGKNKNFAIDGDKIVVLAGAKLDFEARPEVEVTIEARGSDGRRYTEEFTITVENAIEWQGGKGVDTLRGDGSAEEFHADDGDDKIFAGDGDDLIWAGKGVDRVTGGTGADHFIFKTAGECGDIIADFKSGEDKIVLAPKLAKTMRFDDADFFINEAVDADGPYIAYHTDTGALFFDADGAGGKRAVLIATLLDGKTEENQPPRGAASISIDDFIV